MNWKNTPPLQLVPPIELNPDGDEDLIDDDNIKGSGVPELVMHNRDGDGLL